jgi:hypothetical protein
VPVYTVSVSRVSGADVASMTYILIDRARAAFIIMLPVMLVSILLAMKTHELCF